MWIGLLATGGLATAADQRLELAPGSPGRALSRRVDGRATFSPQAQSRWSQPAFICRLTRILDKWARRERPAEPMRYQVLDPSFEH